jgi:hypothetical protein
MRISSRYLEFRQPFAVGNVMDFPVEKLGSRSTVGGSCYLQISTLSLALPSRRVVATYQHVADVAQTGTPGIDAVTAV